MTEETGLGIGIGTVVACIVSWSLNHSVIWALFHGFCGWFYLGYYFLKYVV